MATFDLTAANDALKEFYIGPARRLINDGCMLYSNVTRNGTDVEGREAVLAIDYGRNEGVGSRDEGDTLPVADHQKYTDQRVQMKYLFGRIQLSVQVMETMKSDRGGFFTRPLEREMKGVVRDMKIELCRQVFNDVTQSVAQLTTGGSSTTVNLHPTTTVSQLRSLRPGMLIDIGTTSVPTDIASARTIQSVNTTALTFVISGAAVTTDANDYVFRSGSGTGKELTGLQEIIQDSGTLFGVDPTAITDWKARVWDNNGDGNRTLTDNLIEKAVNQVDIDTGTPDGITLFVSHGVQRAYAAQYKNQVRFNDTTTYKGGFSGLPISVGGVTVSMFVDRFNPTHKAHGVRLADLKVHELTDWKWMNEDGAVLSRVSNMAEYEATIMKFHELTTYRRNVHFVIEELDADDEVA